MEPHLGPTKDPRRFVAEFAPTIETRNVQCAPVGTSPAFECTFESRSRDFFAEDFAPWAVRKETLCRSRKGRWHFGGAACG